MRVRITVTQPVALLMQHAAVEKYIQGSRAAGRVRGGDANEMRTELPLGNGSWAIDRRWISGDLTEYSSSVSIVLYGRCYVFRFVKMDISKEPITLS